MCFFFFFLNAPLEGRRNLNAPHRSFPVFWFALLPPRSSACSSPCLAGLSPLQRMCSQTRLVVLTLGVAERICFQFLIYQLWDWGQSTGLTRPCCSWKPSCLGLLCSVKGSWRLCTDTQRPSAYKVGSLPCFSFYYKRTISYNLHFFNMDLRLQITLTFLKFGLLWSRFNKPLCIWLKV